MNYLKSRISLILAIVMIAMVAFPFVTLASSDSPNIDMSVKLNGVEMKDKGEHQVKGGETIYVEAIAKTSSIYMIGYYFEEQGYDNMTVITDKTKFEIKVPNDFGADKTSKLFIEAVLATDNGQKVQTSETLQTKTGWQQYNLTMKEANNVEPSVKYGSKELENRSTTIVEVGDELVLSGIPSNLVKSIYYVWDKGQMITFNGRSVEIEIPQNFADGNEHRLDIIVRDVDGNDSIQKTYFFRVNAGSDELEILPWEKESKDLEALAVSLRNDPESEKANKNVYALGEKVTYFVDYKNGGKDIKAPVELKLELPLEFDLISADGGKVDNAKRTITWNFPNGLENEAAGTKVVEIEYVKFDKKSTDSETVYPLATISKDNKVADESAVINFIYRDEDTVIEDLHTPYMFGDKDRPTFRPDDSISRAEGALVLTRILLGQNAINNVKIASEYPDLGETYLEAQKAIVAATKYGIINGYTDGYYRPNTKMTRAEFMKILAKYIEINAEDEGIDGLEIKSVENRITLYKNVVKRYVVGNTTVSEHWAIEEVSLLERLNMTSVDGKNKDLRLDEEITRAEVAQLVNFFLLRAPAETNSKTKSGFEDVSKKHELFADIIEATREAHEFTITLDGTEIAE